MKRVRLGFLSCWYKKKTRYTHTHFVFHAPWHYITIFLELKSGSLYSIELVDTNKQQSLQQVFLRWHSIEGLVSITGTPATRRFAKTARRLNHRIQSTGLCVPFFGLPKLRHWQDLAAVAGADLLTERVFLRRGKWWLTCRPTGGFSTVAPIGWGLGPMCWKSIGLPSLPLSALNQSPIRPGPQ